MLFQVIAVFCFSGALAFPSNHVSHPFSLGSLETRIVNGQDASAGEFPWQVTLQRSTGSHFCGGSLISTRHVMSAAHCQVSQVTVGLGAVDYRNPDQAFSQQVFTPHPQYNSNTFDYDYAVITMSGVATLNNLVQVIPMAAQGVEYSGWASTSGWGYTTGYGNQVTPYTLQKTDIPLVSQSNCQSVWGSSIEITNRIQCAGGNGVSSCMGDSGGPLTIEDNGTTVLIGAVSWVQSRCSGSYPGGYAKISAVRSWIDQQM